MRAKKPQQSSFIDESGSDSAEEQPRKQAVPQQAVEFSQEHRVTDVLNDNGRPKIMVCQVRRRLFAEHNHILQRLLRSLHDRTMDRTCNGHHTVTEPHPMLAALLLAFRTVTELLSRRPPLILSQACQACEQAIRIYARGGD
jgi:hypothetical protein